MGAGDGAARPGKRNNAVLKWRLGPRSGLRRERILLELMTLPRKLKASRDASKWRKGLSAYFELRIRLLVRGEPPYVPTVLPTVGATYYSTSGSAVERMWCI